ncbi:MAG: hypothetical protein GWP08_03985 [Nitrospiraceae bacterium]|nr:hypothetical protein [Nitrospiraceae bacterium]
MPKSNDWISPVLDVAGKLLLVDCDGDQPGKEWVESISEMELAPRAMRIASLGVDVLICGAVSRPLESILLSNGVRVLPEVCGPVQDVLRAYLSGQLDDRAFRMPGCCGHTREGRGPGRRGRRHGRGRPCQAIEESKP